MAILSAAFARQQMGELDAAAAGYRAVLARQPDEIYALHLLAHALARRGAVEQGLAAVLRAERLHPGLEGLEDNLGNIVEIALQRSSELCTGGCFSDAARLLRELHRALPDHLLVASQLADTLLKLDLREEAIAHCAGFLARHPSSEATLSRLARARMPGADYYATLRLFHHWLRPAGYLEIGLHTGMALSLADPATWAVGVDPTPLIDGDVMSNGARVLRMTSDAFFAERDLAAELGGRPLDLAFIDGLHTFEQVLLDFMNIEARSHRHTVVLIHDAIPMNALSSARDRTTSFWTGDVWRAVLLLLRERPDLTLFTLPVFPTGLCVITNLSPGSTHLRANYDALVAEGMGMRFDMLGEDPDARLAVRRLDWPATVAAIEKAWAE